MFIEKIDNKNKQLFISIPLINRTGKTRIKSRSYRSNIQCWFINLINTKF